MKAVVTRTFKGRKANSQLCVTYKPGDIIEDERVARQAIAAGNAAPAHGDHNAKRGPGKTPPANKAEAGPSETKAVAGPSDPEPPSRPDTPPAPPPRPDTPPPPPPPPRRRG
jgi:hypothetical protein